jgi:Glycosyl transferase 4-like domain
MPLHRDYSVLIVSPHFPPVNAPDHHRVRMSLPYFQDFGWKAQVLTVHPDHIERGKDELLARGLPADVPVTRTRAIPLRQTRLAGFGDLGLRSYPYLRTAGNYILRHEKIDLVYFSTTVFSVLPLARSWQRKFGIPYAIDLQDPWLSDYENKAANFRPPGGRLKYGTSQFLARMLEPYSLRRAAHITSVSPAYPPSLLKRYSWLNEDRFTVLPFAASENDFDVASSLEVKQTVFDKTDGKRHWVYVGRGGADLAFAVRALFQALQQARLEHSGKFGNVVLHFVGTDYAPAAAARKTIQPLAVEYGITDMVTEQTARIPYFEALQCLRDADALIVLGSDDPGYTASKIYPYILAQKPLLAIFHELSSVVELIRTTQSGTLVTFGSGSDVVETARAIRQVWLNREPLPKPNTDWDAFSHFGAREMTRRLCAVFDACVVRSGWEAEASDSLSMMRV